MYTCICIYAYMYVCVHILLLLLRLLLLLLLLLLDVLTLFLQILMYLKHSEAYLSVPTIQRSPAAGRGNPRLWRLVQPLGCLGWQLVVKGLEAGSLGDGRRRISMKQGRKYVKE